jgi:uncharacterized membrane protein YdjX (TVP38/TMEM64 family)
MNKKRLFLLVLLFLVIVLLYQFVLKDRLTLEQFNLYRVEIRGYVDNHYIFSVSLYLLLYIVIAGLSLPGLPVLTVMGGFAFGAVAGALYTCSAATTGAVIAFLLSRYLVGEWVQERFKNKLDRINTRLDEEGVYYLLALRLMPPVPFTWLNLACGLTSLRLSGYIWATALGIFPATFLVSNVGAQLGTVASVKDFFSTSVLLAIGLLSILALLPVLGKRFLQRHGQKKQRGHSSKPGSGQK